MLRQISRLSTAATSPHAATTVSARCISHSTTKLASNNDTGSPTDSKDDSLNPTAKPSEEPKLKKKTQAELDQELQLKLQGLAGDGGSAGVEYEDGKPVSMKRSVKNNMFRYI